MWFRKYNISVSRETNVLVGGSSPIVIIDMADNLLPCELDEINSASQR
jgi:hypothetical protein